MGSSTRRKALRKQKFSQSRLDNIEPTGVAPTNIVSSQRQTEPTEVPETVSQTMDFHEQNDSTLSTLDSPAPRPGRFICFAGNLPFTTTREVLSHHFRKVSPISIRHSTVRDTGQSRGFAFLEFDAYDRLKTCLGLYHHSVIDDGISPPRKINVELTAGGGGAKSTNRRSKLKVKNTKLNEQRKKKTALARSGTSSENRVDTSAASGIIHPSRRMQVTGGMSRA